MIPYPHINPILIKLGPLQIKWYGLAYIFGVLIGFFIVKKDLVERLKFDTDQILNAAYYLMLGIILGGRLGYILFYDLPFYLKNPFEVLAIWHGGMSYHGGAIGCVMALWLFSYFHNKNFLVMLDLLGIGSAIGLGLGRLSNFINGELYGRITFVPWSMVFPTAGTLPRHPSQLYEAFCEGLVLFLILFVLKNFKRANGHSLLRDGQLFGCYLFFYGVFRFVLEYFREPDPQLGFFIYNLSMGQILSLIMIFSGVIFYRRMRTAWLCAEKPSKPVKISKS